MSGDKDLVVALDVGGTSVKAGLVHADGEIQGEPRQFDSYSNRGKEEILARFGEILKSLFTAAGAARVVGIGVGMPGPFDYEHGISLIQGLGKYEAILGVNLTTDWRERMHLPGAFPIRFVNDAAAFALGEAHYGAARGAHKVICITLGTGCGASFLVDGRPVTEGEGVPRGGEVYHVPFHGEIIDEWISRRGILRLWQEITPRSPQVEVKELAQAAGAGDVAAKVLFDRWGGLLAAALGPVAETFRPDLFVVGGQIAKSMDLFDRPLRERLSALDCRLVPAATAHAALLGAASLVLTAR